MILGCLRALDRIQLVGPVLPDVELGAWYGGAADVTDVPFDERRDAGALLGDAGAVFAQRRAGRVEGTEDRRLGRACRQRVLERVDEHRQSQRVRPQDPLLAAFVGDLARAREDLDRPPPLVLRQLDLAHERVRVAHERLQHLS